MKLSIREQAEWLRQKYSRVFGVPIDSVTIIYTEDDNATIKSPGKPTWTLR